MNDLVNTSNYIDLGLDSIFYLTLVIFGFYTLSFMYHWFNYSEKQSTALSILLVYMGVSLVIIGTAFLSLRYVI